MTLAYFGFTSTIAGFLLLGFVTRRIWKRLGVVESTLDAALERIGRLEILAVDHQRRLEKLEDHPDFRTLRQVAKDATALARGFERKADETARDLRVVRHERDEYARENTELQDAIDALRRRLNEHQGNGSAAPAA